MDEYLWCLWSKNHINASQMMQIKENQVSGGQCKSLSLAQVFIGSKEQFMFALTNNGQIYIWGNFSVPTPTEDDEGTLYGWGDDSDKKYGVLGLGNQYKAIRPCPNSQLFDYMIKNISISTCHACAVDSSGRLFCWGYGPNGELGLETNESSINIPTIVTKQKQIIIKKAIAHYNYTAFCSSAGYLYLYGLLRPSLKAFDQIQNRSVQNPSFASMLRSSNLAQNSKMNPTNANGRPAISMTQIISLSENFIQDVIGGDTFLIGLTNTGDVFFVDDSLDCEQINTSPIEQVAIAGQKVFGLSKNDKITQWSIAGLNKLSFNKNNKLLLRQDFQMREYKIMSEFSKNVKLCNIPFSKQLVGICFEDSHKMYSCYEKYQNESDDQLDMIQNQQIIIAELIPKQMTSLDETESIISQSQDQIQEQFLNQSNHQQNISIIKDQEIPEIQVQEVDDQLEIHDDNQQSESERSFQNITTPEISISAIHDKFLGEGHLPSFGMLNPITFEENHQVASNENESNNIFHYQGINLVNQVKETVPEIAQPVVNKQQTSCASTNQCFFEENNVTTNENQNIFPYRPSSIRSAKQESNNKSEQQNSSSSLKHCADQMKNYGRGSKMDEVSYPSFLNFSESNKELDQNFNSNGFSPDIISQNNHPDINIEQKMNSAGNNCLVPKYEFSIKIQSQDQSKSPSEMGSREASITRTQNMNGDKLEESLVITLDSFKIKAKRTTTPRRLLQGYSQSKRSMTSDSQNIEQQQISNQFSDNKSSSQSELSNGFNITSNSIAAKDIKGKQTIDKQVQQQNTNFGNYQSINIIKKNEKKLNNSAGSLMGSKRKSFIQAILKQQNQNQLFIQKNPTSVTQIYNDYSPLKDETQINIEQSKIIEEEEHNQILSSGNSQEERKVTENLIDDHQNEENEESYLISADQSNIQNQLLQQQRVSNLFNRQTIGTITQTDDNFEVEYTISNSCTPQSKQSTSNIIRKINFDDASGETGGVIRMSECGNNTKFITSFTLSFNQKQMQQELANSQIVVDQQLQENQSQSMIFNDNQKSPEHQSFIEDNNPVSNIKSSSTPSNQENTTHLILLTEEKFKNLKSEISQQQDSQVTQFLVTQNPLNISPLNDQNNFTKDSSKSFLLGQTSSIQNLSSFIKNSKYLQVYENYRKGFQIIEKLRSKRRFQALKQIKKIALERKQRVEFLQNFVRFLCNTFKNHLQQQKHYGFKRIKKFYKERQLQDYILKKQNEIAQKASFLVKIDQILINHHTNDTKMALKQIREYIEQQRKAKAEKQKKSALVIFNIIQRKNKSTYEKSLRSVQNWINEKKIIEMNLKIVSRIVNKIALKQKKSYFQTLQQFTQLRRSQSVTFGQIMRKRTLRYFYQFRQQCQNRTKLLEGVLRLSYSFEVYMQKLDQLNAITKWRRFSLLPKKLESIFKTFEFKLDLFQKQKLFKIFKEATQAMKRKEQQSKLQKAMLLIIFKKLDDIKKKNLKFGWESLAELISQSEETMMVHKSNTLTTLSFNANNELSLILNNKKQNQFNTTCSVLDQEANKQYLTQDDATRGNKQSSKQDIKNYLSNQNTEKSFEKGKANLNNYLSRSPYYNYDQKAQDFFFESRRNTESSFINKNKPIQNEKSKKQKYVDCPIPLTAQQERVKNKQAKLYQAQNIKSQNFENLNQLNVSIKEMNKAFKDQISRIKEKQEEQNYSYLSSLNSMTHYNNSDEKSQILDIEFSATPDHLANLSNEKIKLIGLKRGKENASPIINPLCTSESQNIIKALMKDSKDDISKSQSNLDFRNLKTLSANSQYNTQQQLDSSQNINKIVKNDRFSSEPKTSQFCFNIDHQKNENVVGSAEDKFKIINQTYDMPLTFRENIQMNSLVQNPVQAFLQSTMKNKSDTRYQETNPNDHDYSIDFEQQHDMFDEFDVEEKQQQLQRLKSSNNISLVKSSIADFSKKMNSSQNSSHYDQAESKQSSDNKISSSNIDNVIANAYQHYKNLKNKYQNSNLKNQTSPKLKNDAAPSTINRQLLNELAANFKLMELTPEADYQQMLNSKSIFNKEESIYSSCQYAEPMEMALSPRGVLNDISQIPQNITTTQTQFNFFVNNDGSSQQDQNENQEEFSDSLSQVIEQSRDSRPYDFELSSNSKYKIVSENQQVKTILSSQIAQPSMIQQHNNICKKLTFGYDKTKQGYNTAKNNQQKQKSTLILSGGEQTINFVLTQEDEEENENKYKKVQNQQEQQYSDEELEVGEENSAEIANKLNIEIPESHIQQLEQQEEKLTYTLSQADLMSISNNRMKILQQMKEPQCLTSRQNVSQSRKSPQTQRDFIQNNIDRLKKMVKISPRYEDEFNSNQSYQYKTEMASARNSNQGAFGFFKSKQSQVSSSQYFSQNQLSKESQNQFSGVWNSSGFGKTMGAKEFSKHKSTSRNASKENQLKKNQYESVKERTSLSKRSNNNCQPVTKMIQSSIVNKSTIFQERTNLYRQSVENINRAGSFSFRGTTNSQNLKSRNTSNNQLQSMNSNGQSKVTSSMEQSKCNSSINLRQFY